MPTPETFQRRSPDLSIERAHQAREVIPPEFVDSPQYESPFLNELLGRRVVVKVETLNPLRSFKGRGVNFALRDIAEGEVVVCASSGNFGQAVAYVCTRAGAVARVFTPAAGNRAKRERMRGLGAEVIEIDGDLAAVRAAARLDAEARGARYVVDGRDGAIAEGAATIAAELSGDGEFDAVVAPIGDGSLISGLGLWFGKYAPATRIIGITPTSAPAMRDSWAAGRPLTVAPRSGFAEGISIPRPDPHSLTRLTALVDDIVEVSDDDLRRAMTLIAEQLGVLAEPAGAAGIAALASGTISGSRVATVVTGANRRPIQ